MPLSANEALVILTGGTPEAVVAGIAVGFKTILYVASDDNEELLQKQKYLNPRLSRSNWSLIGVAGKAIAVILCFSLRLAHAVQIAMRRR